MKWLATSVALIVERVQLPQRLLRPLESGGFRLIPPVRSSFAKAVLRETRPLSRKGDGSIIRGRFRRAHAGAAATQMRLEGVNHFGRERRVSSPPTSAVHDEPLVVVRDLCAHGCSFR